MVVLCAPFRLSIMLPPIIVFYMTLTHVRVEDKRGTMTIARNELNHQ